MASPILDNHVHLEPYKGRNVEAARDFEKSGGTHLIISHLPYDEVTVRTADDFRRSFDLTVAMKDKVNKDTSVKAYATVGPYPAELLDLAKLHGLEKAKEIVVRGMEIAAEYVSDGRALAIGEVGRPHFPVSTEVWRASNEILELAMALAKRVDCAIVLHTESATPENMRELAQMAERVGLDKNRVVKHYSPPLILPEENFGLMPSVLVGRDSAERALRKGTRFLMETDFLDDPRRPGAVLAITTVPRRTKTLLQKGMMTEEQAYKIHVDNPRMSYGSRYA